MKMLSCIMLIICSLIAPAAATASDEIDMATYNCGDLFSEKESDVLLLIFWIDGYLSGKSGDMKVNADALGNLADRLITYCDKNRKVLIMKAVQNVKGKY